MAYQNLREGLSTVAGRPLLNCGIVVAQKAIWLIAVRETACCSERMNNMRRQHYLRLKRSSESCIFYRYFCIIRFFFKVEPMARA